MNRCRLFRLRGLAVLIVLLPISAVVAQPVSPTATQPAAASPSEEAPLTMLEAMMQATEAIELAEEHGPEAADARQKASRLANYVLRIDPINARAGFIRGRVLLLEGRPREARGYFNKYIDSRDGESDWLGFKLLGDIYLQGRYYPLACAKYERALELNPDELDIYVGLTQAELRDKKPDKAVAHARRAVELNERRDPVPGPHAVLAAALLAKRELDEAQAAATRAKDIARVQLRKNPGDIILVRELDRMIRLEADILKREQMDYPERAEVYLGIARTIRERADAGRLLAYHEALSTLLLGVESTEPYTPADLLYETAKLQRAIGRNDEALATLEKLFDKSPDHAEAAELQQMIKQEQASP